MNKIVLTNLVKNILFGKYFVVSYLTQCTMFFHNLMRFLYDIKHNFVKKQLAKLNVFSNYLSKLAYKRLFW